MKLMTAAILKKIPALYAQESKGEDATVHVKFFDPSGSFTWFATEFDPTAGRFFGKVFSSHCTEGECGYFMLAELEGIKGRMGLGIERDRYFKPCRLGDCKNA